MKITQTRTFTALILTAVLLASAAPPARAQTDHPRFRVAVLAEHGGIHGPFVAAAMIWLNDEAKRDNFAFDSFTNPDQFTRPFLAKYQLILQLNYPPYHWSDETKTAFQDYIEQGKGGWVGLHHASLLGEFDGYPMWPWFSDFLGGIRFKNYIAKRVTGTVVIEDTNHPCFAGLPPKFVVHEEEWYTWDKDPRPNVHVLASVDESSYQPSSDIKMGDHPVIWTNEKVKARNVYIQMGHHPTLFDNDNYKILLRNSILWAAGADGTNSTAK